MEKSIKFAEWMRDTVKSIHYTDNQAMERAFEKLLKDNQIEQESEIF